MIELLKRPEGATVEQIAEATGWQKHTIRGAISGALKKKLGLNGRGHAHPRGRPQQDRRQGQHHRLPHRRLRSAADDHRETQAPGLPAPPARQSRGRGPAHRAGPHPRRPRPRPCRAGAYRGHRRSGPSSASTTTACSAAAGRAGARTCPMPAPSRSSRCSGSRSWSCSAACPRAARPSSSRTAPCRTDRSASRHLRRRGLPPGGDLCVGVQSALELVLPLPFAPYMLSAKQEHRVWRLRRDGSTAAPTATDGI